jgi:hypothetical protein
MQGVLAQLCRVVLLRTSGWAPCALNIYSTKPMGSRTQYMGRVGPSFKVKDIPASCPWPAQGAQWRATYWNPPSNGRRSQRIQAKVPGHCRYRVVAFLSAMSSSTDSSSAERVMGRGAKGSEVSGLS